MSQWLVFWTPLPPIHILYKSYFDLVSASCISSIFAANEGYGRSTVSCGSHLCCNVRIDQLSRCHHGHVMSRPYSQKSHNNNGPIRYVLKVAWSKSNAAPNAEASPRGDPDTTWAGLLMGTPLVKCARPSDGTTRVTLPTWPTATSGRGRWTTVAAGSSRLSGSWWLPVSRWPTSRWSSRTSTLPTSTWCTRWRGLGWGSFCSFPPSRVLSGSSTRPGRTFASGRGRVSSTSSSWSGGCDWSTWRASTSPATFSSAEASSSSLLRSSNSRLRSLIPPWCLPCPRTQPWPA